MEFNELMESMLAEVPESLDKREGSLIYTTLAPVAYELSKAYWVLAYIMNLFMPDTSEGEWLDKEVDKFGILRTPATCALRKLVVKDKDGNLMKVDIGSRFRINELSLKVTDEIQLGEYKAVAEQAGTIGNQYLGVILPLTNIEGLGSAELRDVLIQGAEEESDEELLDRFYRHVRTSPFGGNIPDYTEEVLKIDGVGDVQVFPIWNGPGTVLLMISDESNRCATSELIKKVQDYFQPADDPASGLAPIGHLVTVKTSSDLSLAISTSIRCSIGSSYELIKTKVEQSIRDYVASIGFKDEIVYVSRLMVAILNVEGVIDVQNLKVNGSETNIALNKTAESYQVPVISTITLTEI